MRKLISVVTLIACVYGFLIASIPAKAAPAVPSILQVDNKRPLPAGGQNITLFGKNLNVVTSVSVDKLQATIVAQSRTSLTFISPPHEEGQADVSLSYGPKTSVFRNALSYKASAQRVPVPLPFIPETLRVGRNFSILPTNSDWKIKATTTTNRICSVTGLVVKALRKGECAISMVVDAPVMDRTYRSRLALYFIIIN